MPTISGTRDRTTARDQRRTCTPRSGLCGPQRACGFSVTEGSRTTPALYLLDEGRWIIVVASNGGADWEPGWWLNLRAGSPAAIEVDGASTLVAGVEVDGAERDRLWSRLNEMFHYEGYQPKVSRRIAVVALSPVG